MIQTLNIFIVDLKASFLWQCIDFIFPLFQLVLDL